MRFLTDELFIDAPQIVTELEAAAHRRATKCGEGDLVWRMWGEGPAVVLFHGAFGSWTHWARSIGALAKDHQVLVPDIPGFGDSDLPPEPRSVDGLAQILTDGLIELLTADDPIAFVGFSFGGQMAARCARNLRERACQVVLVSSSNLGIPRGRPEPAASWRRLGTRAERDLAHRRNLEIMMIHDPAQIDADAVWIQRNNAERARLRELPTSPMGEALREAGSPIAFVCGDQDLRCNSSLELIEDVLRAIDPNFRTAILRGQGHWLSWEAPEKLNAVLLSFLDRDPFGLFTAGSRIVL